MNDDNVIIWRQGLPPCGYHETTSLVVLNQDCDKIKYNYKRQRWETEKGRKTKAPQGWTFQPTYREN